VLRYKLRTKKWSIAHSSSAWTWDLWPTMLKVRKRGFWKRANADQALQRTFAHIMTSAPTGHTADSWASEKNGGKRLLDFEIWYFPINFSVQKCLFWVGTRKFHHCWPLRKNSFWPPLARIYFCSPPHWKKSFRRPWLSCESRIKLHFAKLAQQVVHIQVFSRARKGANP